MTTTTSATAGDALRSLRRELDLTQDQLSAHTGVNQGHISQIERGNRPLTGSTAFRITAKLGVDPMRLLAHVDPDGNGQPDPAGPLASGPSGGYGGIVHLGGYTAPAVAA